LAAATAGPAAGSRLKTGLERFVGRQTAAILRDQYGLSRSPTLTRWVERVGRQVVGPAPRHDVRWEFFVLDTDEVNAVAAPGGFIFVTRGLLHAARSEDEVAAVMAHEAGHVIDSHSFEQTLLESGMLLLLNALDGDRQREARTTLAAAEALLSLRFSRDDELEADQWGVRLAAEAGYRPEGMLSFFDTLRAMEGKPPKRWEVLLSTHPPEAARRRDAEKSPWLSRPDPAWVPRRVQSLTDRCRWNAALRLSRQSPALRGQPAAAEAADRLTRLLAALPSAELAPLPESARKQWQALETEESRWKETAKGRCRQLNDALTRAFAQRKVNEPLGRLLFARINPEDPLWLYTAWRVAFLRQKVDDALMRCIRAHQAGQRGMGGLQQARSAVRTRGAVQSLFAAGQDPLGAERSAEVRSHLDTALANADEAACLAHRALRDMLPPLLALLDPTRPRSVRLNRSRLLAAETTLAYAELETQRTWQRAVEADRHLSLSGLHLALADLASVELSGQLCSAQCLQLAAHELSCAAADLRPAGADGQTVAQCLETRFPALEHLKSGPPGSTATWIARVSPVDLSAACVMLELVQRAFREEAEARL
jgi:predicted Zn-dependent protease